MGNMVWLDLKEWKGIPNEEEAWSICKIRELPLICSWLYNHAPCDMYGSRESVRRNFE